MILKIIKQKRKINSINLLKLFQKIKKTKRTIFQLGLQKQQKFDRKKNDKLTSLVKIDAKP